jgi:hypothetical protein
MFALAAIPSREFFSIHAVAAGQKLLPIEAERRENLIHLKAEITRSRRAAIREKP